MTDRTIDCEQALKQIYEYIDQELRGGDREAMQRHLHTCKSCFSRVEFERLLKRKVGELREEEASLQVSLRVRRLLENF